ncbi:MAG: diguanylate cyclase [Deltaproteobacteria bacterium]|nr:diguanylate cyclase [Deltaproteobacteria bacterium]
MALGRHVARGIRWFERRLLVELSVFGFAVCVGLELLVGGQVAGLAVTLLLVVMLIKRTIQVLGRMGPGRVDAPDKILEFMQLEMLLVSTGYLLILLTGRPESPLYPLLFALLAAIGGLEARARNVWVVCLLAAGLEALSVWVDWRGFDWGLMVRLGAIGFFPFMSRMMLSALAGITRQQAEAARQHERERNRREAEEYRLLSSGSAAVSFPDEQRREYRQRSSLKQLERGIGNLMDILQEALRPHTVAVFLLSTDERSIRLKDARSESDHLLREPMLSGEGVIGAILKQGHSISFDHLRDSYSGLSYYAERPSLKTFMGVPILEPDGRGHEHLRGVLLADRRVDVPFGEDDERLLMVAAREIVRIRQTEQVISDMDEVKSRTKLFFDAAKRLSRTVNLQEVLHEVLESVCGIYEDTDFAAIALVEDEKSLILEGALGDAQESWIEEHKHKAIPKDSLCWLTIKRGEVLPLKPYHEMAKDQRHPFGRSMKIGGLESLKCFPLKKAGDAQAGDTGYESQPGDQVIGTLVVGSSRRHLFPEDLAKTQDRVDLLYTLAMMAATNIQNAQRYQTMERMATTDGLTGLHNHRRFQEMLDLSVAESQRYERPLSMLLTDIDHFKNVNDTYGHPVGDAVLKRVARVLSDLARTSDRVCRYGGEEFTIILPETDREGAVRLAERFREAIKEQTFEGNGERFSITMSLGACTMPDLAQHKQELIDRSDQALYYAKNNGRDRTVHYGDMGA